MLYQCEFIAGEGQRQSRDMITLNRHLEQKQYVGYLNCVTSPDFRLTCIRENQTFVTDTAPPAGLWNFGCLLAPSSVNTPVWPSTWLLFLLLFLFTKTPLVTLAARRLPGLCSAQCCRQSTHVLVKRVLGRQPEQTASYQTKQTKLVPTMGAHLPVDQPLKKWLSAFWHISFFFSRGRATYSSF